MDVVRGDDAYQVLRRDARLEGPRFDLHLGEVEQPGFSILDPNTTATAQGLYHLICRAVLRQGEGTRRLKRDRILDPCDQDGGLSR